MLLLQSREAAAKRLLGGAGAAGSSPVPTSGGKGGSQYGGGKVRTRLLQSVADAVGAFCHAGERRCHIALSSACSLYRTVPQIVYRTMEDGDFMLTNRQPTLHKPGMMGHRARVMRCECPTCLSTCPSAFLPCDATLYLPSPTAPLSTRLPPCSRAYHSLPLRQLRHLQRGLRRRRNQPASAAGAAA